jgi:hypothetical protein
MLQCILGICYLEAFTQQQAAWRSGVKPGRMRRSELQQQYKQLIHH